jgi:hypothetical protein
MRRYREDGASYLWVLIFVLLLLLFLFSALLLDAKGALAGPQYCGGPFDKSCAQVEYEMRLKRQARARARARNKARARSRARRKKHHHHKSTKVYGYTREKETDPVVCRPYISVVGSQFVTKGGAEDSAIKAWQEQTRYTHGERFMDWSTAENQQVRCVRSSVGELGVKAFDLTAKFYRCEVKGKPCMPPFESGK